MVVGVPTLHENYVRRPISLYDNIKRHVKLNKAIKFGKQAKNELKNIMMMKARTELGGIGIHKYNGGRVVVYW